MDLHDLVRSLLGVTVEIDGREVRVDPPTVRTALVLLASMPGAIAGDAGDLRVFRAGAEGWLPPDLVSLLPEDTYVSAVWALFERAACLPERKLATGSARAEVNWVSLLADFRAAFPGDPLSESWPLFMALLPETGRLRAVGKADYIDAHASMQSAEGAKRRQQIFRDAYPQAAAAKAESPEFMTDEWVAEQIAIAKQTRANARA
jgi:hypothetical protein